MNPELHKSRKLNKLENIEKIVEHTSVKKNRKIILKNANFGACTWANILSVITQDSWP